MMHEWIIFALCLGVGGHIALGVILHAPELWPWKTAGLSGLLLGLLVYSLVQVTRSLWWLAHRRRRESGVDPPLDF
jgi:predicted anti-sigma-YlaC factor YlaD